MSSPAATLAECTIDASAPFEDILALLKLRGGIVLKNLIHPEDIRKMKQEMQPYIDAKDPAKSPDWQGDFFPPTTRKVAGLLTKSAVFGNKFVLNPVAKGLSDALLTRRARTSFDPERKQWSTSKPYINVTLLLEIHPGAAAQTLWVPGSHLWGEDRIPEYSEALRADLEMGDCFFMLCSTYHGGGANTCQPGTENSIRTVCGVGFTLGCNRQEENQFLANDREKLEALPRPLLELAGYDVSLPMLGWYDYGHPLNAVPKYNIPDGDHTFFDAAASVAA